MCKYLAWVQCQLLQQTELCRGELDAFTVAPDQSLLKINLDIPKTLGTNRARSINPTGTPQDSLYSCQKFPYAEGLGQVIIRSLVQSGYFVSLFPQCRQNDDRYNARLPDATACL